jgi:hypothetical protein
MKYCLTTQANNINLNILQGEIGFSIDIILFYPRKRLGGFSLLLYIYMVSLLYGKKVPLIKQQRIKYCYNMANHYYLFHSLKIVW